MRVVSACSYAVSIAFVVYKFTTAWTSAVVAVARFQRDWS